MTEAALENWHEQDESKAVSSLVRQHRQPNDRAWKHRFYRRVSWPIVADKLHRRFQHAADEARTHLPWEHVYVHQHRLSRQVSMYFGQHPLPGPIEEDIEVGASLVVSQDPRGGVAVLFFPFESLNVQRAKPKVIWGYFDGPQQLTDGVIRGMARDFFTYARATSALMAPSSRDRLFVERLEERSRTLEGNAPAGVLQRWTFAALVLGSIATLGLFLMWLKTGDGNPWEPAVGIVALVTGWIAAGAQKLGEARAHARAKALELEAVEKKERDRRLREKRELIRERQRKRRPRPASSKIDLSELTCARQAS